MQDNWPSSEVAREVAKIQDFKKIIDNWPGNWPAKQEFGKITGGPVAEGQ